MQNFLELDPSVASLLQDDKEEGIESWITGEGIRVPQNAEWRGETFRMTEKISHSERSEESSLKNSTFSVLFSINKAHLSE